MYGSVLDEDVVVVMRLRRRVQMVNWTVAQQEPAILVYLVSDGIDQCRIGFLLLCHFVPHHSCSFDGVLAQVTEVYTLSPVRAQSSKRRKCRHNMGCCLETIISEMPKPGISETTIFSKKN